MWRDVHRKASDLLAAVILVVLVVVGGDVVADDMWSVEENKDPSWEIGIRVAGSVVIL